MTITKLPSGRYRATIYVNGKGNVSAAKVLGLPPTSYRTIREAKAAEAEARAKASDVTLHGVTVGEWWETWTTDPLWTGSKKDSTNLNNRRNSSAFVKQYYDLPLSRLSDIHAAEWLAGGKRNNHVPTLRAMFNAAASAKGGRLLNANPFHGLKISKGKGNADKASATEAEVWALIEAAKKLKHPSFPAWLQVAAWTGMRPGEIDALQWSSIDFTAGRIHVIEQHNAATFTYTSPKNGQRRHAILTPQAREALLSLPRTSPYCFLNLRGDPMTAGSRWPHWKATRAAAGWEKSLYLATRHFFGSYLTNDLLMPAEDVAIALGHTDGGDLVRKRYGHRSTADALARVANAHMQQGRVIDLESRRKEAQ